MYVGTIVEFKEEFQAELPGTNGICISTFSRSGEFMSGFIMDNGNIYNLNLAEMNRYLHLLGYCNELSHYDAVNDEKLKSDFNAGVFDEVLKNRKFLLYKYTI